MYVTRIKSPYRNVYIVFNKRLIHQSIVTGDLEYYTLSHIHSPWSWITLWRSFKTFSPLFTTTLMLPCIVSFSISWHIYERRKQCEHLPLLIYRKTKSNTIPRVYYYYTEYNVCHWIAELGQRDPKHSCQRKVF